MADAKTSCVLPTAFEVASCWVNFSASGIVCQAGLPAVVVARQQGNSQKMFMVLVEKASGNGVHIGAGVIQLGHGLHTEIQNDFRCYWSASVL